MGVLSMDLGKLKLPLSKSLQMVQTLALWMFAASFKATAWVQFWGVIPPTAAVQNAGLIAAVKKGCEVTAASWLATTLPFESRPAQPPPARPALPPQNCITIWP